MSRDKRCQRRCQITEMSRDCSHETVCRTGGVAMVLGEDRKRMRWWNATWGELRRSAEKRKGEMRKNEKTWDEIRRAEMRWDGMRSDQMRWWEEMTRRFHQKKCPEQEIVSAPHSGLLDILWARSAFLPAYRLYMFITFAPGLPGYYYLHACLFWERGFPWNLGSSELDESFWCDLRVTEFWSMLINPETNPWALQLGPMNMAQKGTWDHKKHLQ